MEIPLQITVRDLPHSDAIEADIQKKVSKLNSFNKRIMSCRVVIEAAQKHKHQGKEYTAKIDLKVPGKEFAVNKHRHEDVYVAIRDSFNALQRQVESFARKQRGDVKSHETSYFGKVVRLFDDYGFIEGIDGKEYYFHTNHVVHPSFEELAVGTQVEFLETVAGDGLQANHITAR